MIEALKEDIKYFLKEIGKKKTDRTLEEINKEIL